MSEQLVQAELINALHKPEQLKFTEWTQQQNQASWDSSLEPHG